jgi:hypothetical protein
MLTLDVSAIDPELQTTLGGDPTNKLAVAKRRAK